MALDPRVTALGELRDLSEDLELRKTVSQNCQNHRSRGTGKRRESQLVSDENIFLVLRECRLQNDRKKNWLQVTEQKYSELRNIGSHSLTSDTYLFLFCLHLRVNMCNFFCL